MNNQALERLLLRPAAPTDADALIAVIFDSRRTAMPWLTEVHTHDENHWWVGQMLIPAGGVTVAELGGEVIGMTALADGWLEQLYVATRFQRRGVGRALMEHAIEQSPNGLSLFCFARNEPARLFYEAHGFVIVDESDGSGNEEQEPDVTYRWSPAR